MAAVTPSSVAQHSLGSLTLYIATFANTTDNGDTWDSGITDIVKTWANQADAPGTQTSTGAGSSHSSDVITIYLAEDNSAVEVFVLAGGGY